MKNIITKEIEYMKYVLGYKRGVVISEQQSTEGCIKGNCKNGQGTFKNSDGSGYTGEWKDGLYDGKGIYKYWEGSTYTGEWKNGKKDGKGIMKDSGQFGSVYTGEWKDGKRDGRGIWTHSAGEGEDGDVYTGQFKNDELNGQGTAKYVYGDFSKRLRSSYTGQWKDFKFNGQGTYTNPNGVKFSGDWVDDELNGSPASNLDKIKPSNAQNEACIKGNCKDGQGTKKYIEGSVYTGQWKDGKRNGQGNFKWSNNREYTGQWKDGKQNGQGNFKWTPYGEYTGQFKDGKQNGQGTMKYDKNYTGYDVYIGEWKNNEKNGKGTMTYKGKGQLDGGGIFYDGEWKDDKEYGQGTMKFTNGSVYTGQWDWYENGQGTYKNKNGVKFSGIWVTGKLNEKSKSDLDKIKPTKKPSKKPSNNATEPNNAQSNSNCVKPTEPTHRYKNDRNYQYAKSGDCWWAKNITNDKWYNLTKLVKTKPKFQSSIDRLNDGTDLIAL